MKPTLETIEKKVCALVDLLAEADLSAENEAELIHGLVEIILQLSKLFLLMAERAPSEDAAHSLGEIAEVMLDMLQPTNGGCDPLSFLERLSNAATQLAETNPESSPKLHECVGGLKTILQLLSAAPGTLGLRKAIHSDIARQGARKPFLRYERLAESALSIAEQKWSKGDDCDHSQMCTWLLSKPQFKDIPRKTMLRLLKELALDKFPNRIRGVRKKITLPEDLRWGGGPEVG